MVETVNDGDGVSVAERSGPRRSRSQAYFAMAESYIVAVEVLAHQADTAVAPFHMMVGHALELSMKAVLAHAGSDEEWLMMIGHNLDHCHRRARASGFSGRADEGLAALVDVLDEPHRDQRFRYPVQFGGTPHLVAADTAETLRLHLEDVRTWLSSNSRR